MGNRPFKAELKFGCWSRMFVFLIEAFHIYYAEVAICNMVYLFPPDHWNAKRKVLIFSMGPRSQSFRTACTDFMWNPCFMLIPKLDFKIRRSGSLHKVVDGLSLCCWCKISTNVAKYIRIVGLFSFHWRHLTEVMKQVMSMFIKRNNYLNTQCLSVWRVKSRWSSRLSAAHVSHVQFWNVGCRSAQRTARRSVTWCGDLHKKNCTFGNVAWCWKC